MMLMGIAVYDTPQNNRTWMTEATLKSFAETVDWEQHRLVLSDNGSCDATLRLYENAKTWLPFEVIYNGENLGTARAINKVWRQREPGEHALKADNDVTFAQAGWADWMEDVFARDPKIGICGLKRKDILECPWSDRPEYKSTIRMLPHEMGQRWLVVEWVKHVIGTCQGYSSALLDKIGYLTQPSLYGFDDSLSAVRARVAGFQSVFLHGFELDHLDPGGDDYAQWKQGQSRKYFAGVNSDVVLYEAGLKDVYYDGL